MSYAHYIRLAVLAVSLLVPFAIATDLPAQSFFTANLSPAQEPGEVDSPGSGTAALFLAGDGLHFFVSVDSLTGPFSAAHFHQGAAGVNGGVVRTVTGDLSGNSGSGLWTSSDAEPLTPALLQALWRGELYLNFHTAGYPGGELRGQIYPSSGTGFSASLTTGQESHEVDSEATGTASVLLAGNTVLYALTVSGLTGPIAAAHFHNGSTGTNGGVVKTITPDFNGPTAIGMWTPDDGEPLTTELIDDLLLGHLYLNVHTASFGAGEARGQVLLNSGLGFSAHLDPDQENNNVESDGLGTGSFTLTEAGLVYDITVSGLSGPIIGSHFHNAPAGENGGVVRGFDVVDGHASGIWKPTDGQPLTDALRDELIAGNIYVNFHTAAYSGGEIRGQLSLQTGTAFVARLDPLQEPGDVSSAGVGTAALELTDDGLAFSVTVDSLTGPFSAAHFHSAPTGVNGGVVRTITDDFVGNTAAGMWTATDAEPLTPEMVLSLLKGNLYLNVHTASHPGGEVRGQVLLSAGSSLTASLDGDQEVGEVESVGSGTASATVTPAGVVFSLTVDSLTGPFSAAHFHAARLGANGGIVRGITDDFAANTASGVWLPGDDEPLTPDLRQEIMTGGLYLNIHTADHPGGEVRGQVRLNSGFGSAVQLDPDQQTGDVTSDGRGTSSLSLNESGVTFALTHEGLTGPIGVAHFHNGPFGENGGVVRTISGDFAGPTAIGFWSPEDEESLTPDLLRAYLRGEMYLNLHTAAYGAGEIRGQIVPSGAVVTAVERLSADVPDRIALHQNYPNPFNPETRIQFDLDRQVRARLSVFNALGQRVATLVDGEVAAGTYAVTFTARELPSGVYFARLEAGGQLETRMMVILK